MAWWTLVGGLGEVISDRKRIRRVWRGKLGSFGFWVAEGWSLGPRSDSNRLFLLGLSL